MNKVGRNDPCPCGSGKKYKRCHLNQQIEPTPASGVPEEVLRKLGQFHAEQTARQRTYGRVKPEIGTTFQNHEVVAVGSRVYLSKKWTLFPEFLMDYVPLVFGKEWFEEGYQSPIEDNPPIIQLHRKVSDFLRQEQQNQSEQIFKVAMNSHALGYFSFAYDLYTVEHNNNDLDVALLERLRERTTYQGARHELFAEATCLRAGYTIDHEDESDRSAKHTEFIATHKDTGQRIAVEAKSRHRDTSLDYSKTLDTEENIGVRFGRLINQAIAKNPSDPLVIFVETNLPPLTARQFYPQPGEPAIPSHQISNVLNSARANNGGKDPFCLIVFTNYLTQYGETNEPHLPKSILAIQTTVPTVLPQHPQSITELYNTAQMHANIPKDLPSKHV